MTNLSPEIEFNKSVENWILEAISEGHTEFGSLLTSLPGVYPSIVLNTLRELATAGRISNLVMLAVEADVKMPVPAPDSGDVFIQLPVPHPLDFEWRFSDSAIIYILERISEYSSDDDPVSLLGTPSVLRALLQGGTRRDVKLLDKNVTILDSFRNAGFGEFVEYCDFGEDLPLPNASKVVIVDPPWYEAHLKLFTWIARHMSCTGGHILVSLPAAGTRPGAELEVQHYLYWAQVELGLELVEYRKAAVSYKTPPFERNALIAEGISGFPHDWRRGDLAVFAVRLNQAPIARPEIHLTDGEQWDEVAWGRMRVRMRRKEPTRSEMIPTLSPIVSGDVLPSVSRRDDRRSSVDVWTTGNRVFGCEDTRTLRIILEGISTGSTPEGIADRLQIDSLEDGRKVVSNLIQRLTDLFDKEHKEYLNH